MSGIFPTYWQHNSENPVEIPDNFPIVLGGNPDRLSQQPVRTLICQGAFNNREKKR
jgi:hypothetical protein